MSKTRIKSRDFKAISESGQVYHLSEKQEVETVPHYKGSSELSGFIEVIVEETGGHANYIENRKYKIVATGDIVTELVE